MNMSLKSRLAKALNKKNETTSADVIVGEDISIKYCLDVSAKYDRNHLILRGWCLDGTNDVSVAVMSRDGASVYLVKSISEEREDVLHHNGLDGVSLNPGFFNIYDIEHAQDELFVTFKSSTSELTIPLTETQTSVEQLEIAWHELHQIEDETVDEEPQSVEVASIEPTHSTIKHYIERVGIYKNKVLLVRGWCADTETNDEVRIKASNGDKSLRVLKKIRRIRQDVSLNLGLESTDINHGFLFLLELTSAADKELSLTFEVHGKNKVIPINKVENITKEELAGNLIDSNAFTSSEVKIFLIQALGRAYLSDIQSEYIDVNAMSVKLHIDAAFTFETGCFLRGWIADFNSDLSAICLTDGSVASENLLPNLIRKVRTDVNDAFSDLPDDYESGFSCYGHLGKYHEPIYILLFSKSGKVARVQLETKSAENNEIIATQHILADVDPHSNHAQEVYQSYVAPSLLGVWEKRTRLPRNDELTIFTYGQQVEQPLCSIIVPLYGRYDFVLHQISQFESDPDFNDVELIYVIDDPSIEAATKAMCNDIVKLYNTSFKLVSYGKNLGFAGANNIGSQVAQSNYLLLLNSDVIPSQAGWLTRIIKQYQSIDNIGALGVKLVFEDETIQHIGMSFIKSVEFNGIWLNEHPFKGLPSTLAPKVDFKAIPTVTAACLLVEKSKFDAVGKFDTNYILGDFEDSDLCLKLIDSGYQNYILCSEKLYHLERQSQSLVDSGDWKFKLTLFNGWQHSQRWDQLITRLQA